MDTKTTIPDEIKPGTQRDSVPVTFETTRVVRNVMSVKQINDQIVRISDGIAKAQVSLAYFQGLATQATAAVAHLPSPEASIEEVKKNL